MSLVIWVTNNSVSSPSHLRRTECARGRILPRWVEKIVMKKAYDHLSSKHLVASIPTNTFRSRRRPAPRTTKTWCRAPPTSKHSITILTRWRTPHPSSKWSSRRLLRKHWQLQVIIMDHRLFKPMRWRSKMLLYRRESQILHSSFRTFWCNSTIHSCARHSGYTAKPASRRNSSISA